MREGRFVSVGQEGKGKNRKESKNKNMSENKKPIWKREVENEELLEHLKEIETAIGGIASAVSILMFLVSRRREKIGINREEINMIQMTQIALSCIIDNMGAYSGLGEVAGEKELPEDFIKD